MKIALFALGAAAVLASGSGAAGTTPAATSVSGFMPVQYASERRGDTIDRREADIRARIERGQRNGRITAFEARRLERELREVRAKERAYWRNDGRMSQRESAVLHRDLDRLAENVRQQMRDDQRNWRG
jgi:hypothetical protein